MGFYAYNKGYLTADVSEKFRASITLITTGSARILASVTGVTIRNWCNYYGIGFKRGGRYLVDQGALAFMICGDYRGLNAYCASLEIGR